jgi:hypothetical protein
MTLPVAKLYRVECAASIGNNLEIGDLFDILSRNLPEGTEETKNFSHESYVAAESQITS